MYKRQVLDAEREGHANIELSCVKTEELTVSEEDKEASLGEAIVEEKYRVPLCGTYRELNNSCDDTCLQDHKCC